ncbi:hypothetical protein Droror1_Dr00025524 [Drosera rotundifolia]
MVDTRKPSHLAFFLRTIAGVGVEFVEKPSRSAVRLFWPERAYGSRWLQPLNARHDFLLCGGGSGISSLVGGGALLLWRVLKGGGAMGKFWEGGGGCRENWEGGGGCMENTTRDSSTQTPFTTTPSTFDHQHHTTIIFKQPGKGSQDQETAAVFDIATIAGHHLPPLMPPINHREPTPSSLPEPPTTPKNTPRGLRSNHAALVNFSWSFNTLT